MKKPMRQFAFGGFLALAAASPALAQFGIPFAGGIPGLAQSRAIELSRHQARTLLYREALEELRKNPAAADVRECSDGRPRTADEICISRPVESVPAAAQAPAAAAQVPAPGVAAQVPATAAQVPAAPAGRGRKLAVLIGINNYPQPIPSLKTPVADVEDTGTMLQRRFGYEVRYVTNATKAHIIKALNQIATEAGDADSVLIMYAGHGYLMDETKMGYWLPADASVKTAANWVSNNDIAKLLKAIRSSQLILVSDSCFSGSLTREQKFAAAALTARGAVPRIRSVIAFSSGGEEPVSDEGKEGHSVFAYHLIQRLKSASGITPGYDVYQIVKTGVMKDYPQEPQYGAVLSAGHLEGGEFFFQPN